MIKLAPGEFQISQMSNGKYVIRGDEGREVFHGTLGDKHSFKVDKCPGQYLYDEITPSTMRFFNNADGDFVYIKTMDDHHCALLKRKKGDVFETISHKSNSPLTGIWKHKGDTILNIDPKSGVTEYMIGWGNKIKMTMKDGAVQAVDNMQALVKRCKECPTDVVAKRLLNKIKQSL